MPGPLHWVVPGALDQRTGGYIYDRRVVEGLIERGWRIKLHQLEGRFPDPDEAADRAAGETIASMSAGIVVIDGLALVAFAGAIADLTLPWIALVHHPLSAETGLDPDDAARLWAVEGALMRRAAGIIVTSPSTARDLGTFDIDADRIKVVEPGVDPAPLAAGSDPGGPLHLLTVGAITPRKGHLILIEALAGLRDRRWTLTLAGSLERDLETAAALRQAIARHDLGDRITLLGEQSPSGLKELYGSADLFLLPSFHEGYGMALAEALACGLPILSTTAGAIPETVPDDAGLLVEPGDAKALASALRGLIDDRTRLQGLADGATKARERLEGWPQTADRFADALQHWTAS